MPRSTVDHDRSNWTDAERAEATARGYRSRRAGEWPPAVADVRPANYTDDLRRGTVEYDPTWRNYSYQNVAIPDGTVVERANFTQAAPRTAAFVVGPGVGTNLTFRDCNLGNCLLPPGATLERCNTSQSWMISVADAQAPSGRRLDRQFLASHPDGAIGAVKPARAITTEAERVTEVGA